MPGNNNQQPLSYRSDLLKKVIASLQAGECCSLIGTSGVGKSNLARFLSRFDVQHHYWGDDPIWVSLIDLQSLVLDGETADYAVLELIVYCLLEDAEQRHCSQELLQEARQLYKQLTSKATTQQAFRSLHGFCRLLCTRENYKLVLVFDQFEDIWQTLPARFFVNLRHLRDKFKYQVVFLVMTRDRLQHMRSDTLAVETFWELFSAHTYGLGLYSSSDAAMLIEQLASRVGIEMTTDSYSTLLHFCGHHPGLLRTAFWALHNAQWRKLSIDELLQVQFVAEECKKIWATLSVIEQGIVQLIALDKIEPQQAFNLANDLYLKDIVQGDPPTLFSPLFATYVQRLPESSLIGVNIDLRTRQVWLDGQLLSALAPLEFKLLTYLVKHVGSVCQQKDLIRDLYNDDSYTKHDQRIYALLTRLRRALGENAHQPRYIITHHGGGVQLLKGHIIDAEDT
jgi:energy-coupling factor transporter ATP-binding protein EcfA2